MLNALKQRFVGIAHLKTGLYWTRNAKSRPPSRIRWWESPTIIRHVNHKICGERSDVSGAATASLIRQRFPGRTFKLAISVGCGNGAKELLLVENGLVEEFHLFELSKFRAEEGRKRAAERGLSDRVVFHNKDGLKSTQPGRYDLVHWNNSLHHMLDVDQAVGWSHAALRPGGIFFMDDFVGPSRMQWPDKMLKQASKVRASLPERLLRNPWRPDRLLAVQLKRPTRVRMILSDPTECADSARIIPSIKSWFPDAEIKPTGGTVYHLALNDVLHNIDEEEDGGILEQLLRIDDLCTRKGQYHYAVAIAEKQ